MPSQKSKSNLTREVLNQITFRDLEFAGVAAQCYSSRGTPFTKLLPVGMPRIPEEILDCVCYLYEDEEHARTGRNFGGTGFLVAMPSERIPGLNYTYAVTNWHVACQGFPVVRINTKNGGTDIFSFGMEEWEFSPSFDIAALPVPLSRDLHRFALISTKMFLRREDIEAHRMTPGEDVFMVGRFLDHDGVQANLPAVRLGNISVMPTPIEQPNGGSADTFCIDLHSRSGYSGSPVFVYRTPGYNLEEPLKSQHESNLLCDGVNLLKLLGIHFSQFPEMWEIVEGRKPLPDSSKEPLITEGKYVRGLSGMTCVLPAWSIMEVLNMPKLKEQRRIVDDMSEQDALRNQTRPVPEVASPPTQAASNDWLEPEEAARRRDETVRRMLATPPQPRKNPKGDPA